jgi:hypothetical protein
MDAKALIPPVESPLPALVDRGTEIVLHPVARIPRDGFPVADSAEEVRRILETVDRACAIGMRQEGTR